MNLRMGSQVFKDVAIPLLWGTRAVIQDKKNRLSVVDLSGDKAQLEILGDTPAPGIEFEPTVAGFTIRRAGRDIYSYNPSEKLLQGIALRLPECQILPWATRVGSNTFSGNVFSGSGIGIAVDEHSISVGSPVPEGLARLAV